MILPDPPMRIVAMLFIALLVTLFLLYWLGTPDAVIPTAD